MSAMDLFEMVVILVSLGILAWVIIGLYKINKNTSALLKEYERWGTDKENAA